MPRCTVIIPTLNSIEKLRECLMSVMWQTEPVDIIVSDGGSTDATRETVQSIRGIKFVSAPRGIPQQHLAAVHEAETDYIAGVDSDDWIAPHAVQTMANALEDNPRAGMAYSRYRRVDMNHRILPLEAFQTIPYKPGLFLHGHFADHFWMMRRDVYLAVGGHDPRFPYSSDYDLCLRMEERADVVKVEEDLYFYRVNPRGVSTVHRAEQLELTAQAVKEARARRGHLA